MSQNDLMSQLITQAASDGTPVDIESMEKFYRAAFTRKERGATAENPYGSLQGATWGGTDGDYGVKEDRGPYVGSGGSLGAGPHVNKVGMTSSPRTSGRRISYPDKFEIQHIIKIRDKLDDFLDGSNILLKVMNPQTTREMIREMRQEIRTIKREENISELDIIEYLEKEARDGSTAETYEADELPF